MQTGGQSDMLSVLLLLCVARGVWESAPAAWGYGRMQDRQRTVAPVCPSPCQCEEDGIFVMVDCSEMGLSSVPDNLSPLTTYLWVTSYCSNSWEFMCVLSCTISLDLPTSRPLTMSSLCFWSILLCFTLCLIWNTSPSFPSCFNSALYLSRLLQLFHIKGLMKYTYMYIYYLFLVFICMLK